MTVIVNERGENLLVVFAKACDLFTFTVNTIHNEKYFKKRSFDSLGKPIGDLAQRIMSDVYYADELDTDSETDQNKRAIVMERIAANLAAMQANIKVNAMNFHLSTDKAREWTIIVEDFKKAFNVWRKRNKTRLLR